MTNRMLMLCLVVGLAFSLLATGCGGKEGPQTAAPSPTTGTGAPAPSGAPAGEATPGAPAPAGEAAKPVSEAQKNAVPIEIVAYYPFTESHKFIADYLKSVEAANPGKVKLTLYDMQTEEGRKKWMTSGLSCAGVFVNGTTSHEITTNGKKETVAFLQRMDVMWTHQDFETVLKQILEKSGQKFVSPNYKPKPAATEGAPGGKPEAKPKAKPSGSTG